MSDIQSNNQNEQAEYGLLHFQEQLIIYTIIKMLNKGISKLLLEMKAGTK